jgi:hypothetical protein
MQKNKYLKLIYPKRKQRFVVIVSLKKVKKILKNRYTETYNWLIKDLQNKEASDKDTLEVEIPKKHKTPFNYVGTYLLIFGYSRVYCPECEKEYFHTELSLEHWKMQVDRLSGIGGKKFLCPEDHVVFKTADWRS